MDALSDILAAAGVSGRIKSLTTFALPWGVVFDTSGTDAAVLHLVADGTCCLRAGGHLPQYLSAGDIVLMPAGGDHILSDHPESRALPLNRAQERNAALLQTHHGATTTVLTAVFHEDLVGDVSVLAPLPEPMILRAEESAGNPQLDLLIQLMRTEAMAPGAGSGLVLPRLLDSLLALTMRVWLARCTDDLAPSWMRALTDDNLRLAMNDLHAHPADRWTLRTLALTAGLSRATFARRFAESVGETPVAYLNRWRLVLAARRIKDGDLGIEAAAHTYGYSSAAAFSRAFRREFRMTPSELRRPLTVAQEVSARLTPRDSLPEARGRDDEDALLSPPAFMTQTSGAM